MPRCAPSNGMKKGRPSRKLQNDPPTAPAPAQLFSWRVLGFLMPAGQDTTAASWTRLRLRISVLKELPRAFPSLSVRRRVGPTPPKCGRECVSGRGPARRFPVSRRGPCPRVRRACILAGVAAEQLTVRPIGASEHAGNLRCHPHASFLQFPEWADVKPDWRP